MSFVSCLIYTTMFVAGPIAALSILQLQGIHWSRWTSVIVACFSFVCGIVWLVDLPNEMVGFGAIVGILVIPLQLIFSIVLLFMVFRKMIGKVEHQRLLYLLAVAQLMLTVCAVITLYCNEKIWNFKNESSDRN